MIKLFSKNHTLRTLITTILLLGGGLFAAAGLTSCENFLNGGEVRQEIEEAIAYSNAKEITVQLYANEGTGSTLPSGNYTAKQGYAFEISFSENPAYSFIKWTAVLKDDSAVEVTEGITFDDIKSPVTKVKITNDTDSIKIIPVCEKRIEVSGEPSPRYEPLGVSRDRSISVSFTKPLAQNCFFFSEVEIPSGAEIKTNAEGKIWAYVYENQTYLKNITITNIDDYSIAQHFTCPEISDKLLTIAVDKSNPIEFNSGEIYKTVKVTLSKDITDTLGIKMNSAKSWNYQITESTDEKATVILGSDKGTVYLAGTKDYSIGQKITLAYTEDADYQFVRWDYDSSIIYIEDPNNLNTVALVREKTTEEAPTQIRAVCAPRLRVTSFSPVNDSANPTVCKNSSIVITFSQNLPSDEEGLKQMENISITVGGSPVKSSFKAPAITENTVTFVADNSNMLDVPAGQTKTVSVSVPADFCYKLEDGTKVTYGGNGRTFDYKIDASTLDKAEINFTAATGSGTLTAVSGKYSIGQEVSVSFAPADGWKFNGWNITAGGQAVDESKIKIADKYALSTKLIVYEALPGVTVCANTSEVLSFRTGNGKESFESVNPKDTEIVITFNRALDSKCSESEMLKKIRISSDGNSMDSYYTDRILNGDKIIIKNTSPITVSKGSTKMISVTVPSDFYYMDGSNKISLDEQSFTFIVNHTTNAKAKVTYGIINGENNAAFGTGIVAGTINHQNYEEYNIGEEVALAFEVSPGYQFYGWKLTDSQGNAVTNQITYQNSTPLEVNPTLVMNKAEDGLCINAVCYKRPVITTDTVSPYNQNTATEFPKNTSIELSFGHPIDPTTKDEIVINYSAISNFNKSTYFTTTISEDNKTISLTPIPKVMLPVEHAYETVTVTVPRDKIFYTVSGSAAKIYPADSDFTWQYRVNASTRTQTVVRVDSSDAKATSITVNGAVISSGATQTINVEESLNLEYPLEEGYKFSGWKIVSATSGYTVEPSDYVTEGVISVYNAGVKYFELTIDSNKSEKAVMKSFESIDKGTASYGLTVSAKDSKLPKIISRLPEYKSEGENCDSEIQIEFNKPMKKSDIVLSKNGTVQIVDPSNENEHYEDYFISTHIWEGNTLKFKPKNEIQGLLAGKNDLKNLKIIIDYSKIRDSEGNFLQSDSSWIYRIKYDMETVAPSVQNMKVTKPQFELARRLGGDENYEYYAKEKNEDSDLLELSDSFNANTYQQNHVGNKIYFSASVSDYGSGYKGLTIKEKRIKTVDDISVSEPCEDYVYPATKTVFENEPYVLRAPKDGVIQLDFIFEDYAQNKTTKTYYVIKDTALDASSALKNSYYKYTVTEIGSDGPHPRVFSSGYLYFQLSSQEIITYYSDDNGTRTERLDFNDCMDKFYMDENKTSYFSKAQNSTITYKVEWGYSIEDILKKDKPTLANPYSTIAQLSFQRDVSKDCFIRITAMDNVGNTKSLIRVIPGKTGISSMIKENDFINTHLENIVYKDYKVTDYGANNFDYLLVYTYQENETSTPTEFRTRFARNMGDVARLGGNHRNGDRFTVVNTSLEEVDRPKFFPDGIYKFYALPCYCYSEVEYYGCLSAPYTLYYNYSPQNQGSGANQNEPEWPTSFTLENVEHPLSAGYHTATVSFPEIFTPSDNFSYGVKYKIKNTSTYEYGGLDFAVTSGNEYIVSLYAKDSDDNKYEPENPYSVELDATYDNIPPSVEVKNDWNSLKSSTPNKIYLANYMSIANSLPTDIGSAGMYVNEDGLIQFDYYLIKKENVGFSTHEEITRDKLENNQKHTFCYTPGTTVLALNWDSFFEGYYIIVLDLKDKNGNSALYSYVVMNITEEGIPNTWVTDSKMYVQALKTHTSYSGYVFWLQNDTWSNRTGHEGQSMSNSGIVNRAWGYDFWNKKTFAKCSVYNNQNNSLYSFVYPDYFDRLNKGENVSCSSKAVIPGLGDSYQVFYDAPCFAHTMAFPTELLAELNSKTDAALEYDTTLDRKTAYTAVWETKGREYGLKLLYGGESNNSWVQGNTTYIAPVNEIPAGFSYVTVFHFADGSTVMSDVKQK